jgi:hypothetical protein
VQHLNTSPQLAAAQPRRSLTAVGAPGWLAGLAIALVGGDVLLTLGRRRTSHRFPPGAVTAAIAVLAVVMASAAEVDPRTTPLNRTLAQGIVAQQSQEIGIMQTWSGAGRPRRSDPPSPRWRWARPRSCARWTPRPTTASSS